MVRWPPAPKRSVNGERLYPADQVERLRVIKRLMDHGHRPGQLLGRSVDELAALEAPRAAASSAGPPPSRLDALVGLITQHDADAFAQALQQRLARDGLHRFVQDTVAPLAGLVGLAWQQGRLQVFEEHLFTELTERVLRQAIAAVPGGREPRVLLTSVPGEQHAIGLLMAEAVLALEGALCVPLGTQVPVLDIVRAAAAHRADVVALSFSAAFSKRHIGPILGDLRRVLPAACGLWIGGAGARRIAAPDGVNVMASLDDAALAVGQWRESR